MAEFNFSTHPHFFCVGISYKGANASLRGRFALVPAVQEHMLQMAQKAGLDNVLIVSTCNRTEVYGFAKSAHRLAEFICAHSAGTMSDLKQFGYVYQDRRSVQHLLRVSAGLDSHILGDSQIGSQIKHSFARAEKHGTNNIFLDRLSAAVAQASKRTKAETGISNKHTSTASSVAQYIRAHVDMSKPQNILLLGVGGLGKNMCTKLCKQFPSHTLVVINRARAAADKISQIYDVTVKDIGELTGEIAKSDILIVATGADQPVVRTDMIKGQKPRLIFDLSLPRNVMLGIGEMPGVKLVHLDELAHITNRNIADRRKHIPHAGAIVQDIEAEFHTWCAARKYAPALQALSIALLGNSRKTDVQGRKFMARFAVYLKFNALSAAESLKLTSDVFSLEKILDDHAA